MRRDNRCVLRRNHGFTLFEMVVVICSIVILYMVAEERLNELPAAAERANFYAVLEQIKSGVTFEMVNRLAGGRTTEILQLEGANPMHFLIEVPSNYRGELEEVTDAVDRRNAWYFETSTKELVYMVGGASIQDVEVTIGGINVNLGQIRWKLSNVYGTQAKLAGSSNGSPENGSWQALVLMPVREFIWERRPQEPISVN